MERPLRRPIWRPSRLSRFKRLPTEIARKITFARFAFTVFVLPLILYVYREVTRDALIIDPFTVPKRFEEAGLTSDVMANRIGDKLRQIEEATETRRRKDSLNSFKDAGSIPEVEIPGTMLNLKTVIDITRSVFGIYPKHIRGDVVILANDPAGTKPTAAVKQQATVTTYVSEGRDRSAAMSITSDAEDIAMLVERTAETVLGQVNPSLLAAYQEDHGEYDAAVKTIEGIIENPSEARGQKADALFLWGVVLQDQSKYDEAIAKYQQATELDPKFPAPYGNWGTVLLAQSKYGEAIAKYQKSIGLDPKSAITYTNWGLALEDQKQYGEAIAKYQQAIDHDPKFANAYYNWGHALQSQNKYDEAIAKYQKATERDPKLALAYYNWGYALQSQNKYDEAIAKYRKATEIDPKYAVAYGNWGTALQAQSKYGEAIDKYQKAIEIDPKYAIAYYNWGHALQDQDKYREAIDKYQKATDLDPKYAPSYNNWGAALQAQNKYREAIAKYQKAIEIDPSYAAAYYDWGLALRAQGQHDEAALRFKKADELSRPQSK
jgi:superkiller protein 3